MTIARYRTSPLVKFNIQQYLEREFVNSGLYFNIGSGYFDVNGNRADVLTRVNGTTYESFADRWIFETDFTGSPSFPPTIASGVIIDGVFHAKNSSPHKPAIDYNNGRVVFAGTSISSSSTVETSFSYKQVFVDFPESDRANFIFSKIKDNELGILNITPSGNQRALPLVIVDLQDRESNPLELGGGKFRTQRVVFHTFANNENDLETITDILEEQHRKTFFAVNYNLAPQLLTFRGDVASTYEDYTTLQASGSLQWAKIFIEDARIVERDRFYNLRRSRVDWRIITEHRTV